MTGKLARMRSLRLAGNAAEIGPAVEAVRRFAIAEGLVPAAVDALAVAVDEAITNIIRHAYEAPGEQAVTVEAVADADGVEVVLVDVGRPFSPLDWSPPVLEGGPTERPVGGLGIHLMRSLVDRVDYRRDGTRNRLSLRKARTVPLAGRPAGREDGSGSVGA